MKVLVACEESQRVCKSFREKGHEAYSCDILKSSGGFPQFHIKGDVIPILNGNCIFYTEDHRIHYIEGNWDLIIAHPPCTYLTVTGNRWFNIEKYGEKAIQRNKYKIQAIEFFMKIVNAECNKIAIENPIGFMNTFYRKPDQIIQPYMFGDPYEKRTCLWLKNLNLLLPDNIVTVPERTKFNSGKTMPKWYADLWKLSKEERAKERSKTFPGIARAMAEQWGETEK